MRVEDQSGNAGTAEIRLTVNADHPVVTLVQEEVNVFGGAIVIIGEGHLLIEGDTIALWTGGFSKVKSVGLNFGGKVLKS